MMFAWIHLASLRAFLLPRVLRSACSMKNCIGKSSMPNTNMQNMPNLPPNTPPNMQNMPAPAGGDQQQQQQLPPYPPQPYPNLPNGQMESTKGCEYMNPQRFLAYVTRPKSIGSMFRKIGAWLQSIHFRYILSCGFFLLISSFFWFQVESICCCCCLCLFSKWSCVCIARMSFSFYSLCRI